MAMRFRVVAAATSIVAALYFGARVGTASPDPAPLSQSTQSGTIKGHVKLAGKLPGNSVIRMGRDPMCAKINTGKRVLQETVVANLKGDLANVFVKLLGSFPKTAPPSTPVLLDQKGCVYVPRVVGVQIGQTLQVKNSDQLLHNVHSMSSIKANGFNIGQPVAGLVNQFKLQEEDSMVRMRCDVHSWMTAFVGVVNHPYFAVTGELGTFEIRNAPPGTYEIQAWHERYGPIKQMVRVRAGATAMVEFMYTGDEKQPS